MDTKFTIKNFRVFDENGVSLDLKPLTILTGCNSSGKSSIVKAELLLNSFLSQIKHALDNGEEVELSKYKLDFTKYPTNSLGRFDKVVNRGSSSKRISFEYSVYSQMLSKDVDVQLVFSADTNDELNNAYLENICIKIDDNIFYSSDKNEGSYCNLNLIKAACLDFLPLEFIANQLSYVQTDGDRKILVKGLREYDKKRRQDVLRYWRESRKKESIIKRWNDGKAFNWTEENKSFFMIPVIEQLNKVGKEDFVSYIENEILRDPASNGVVWASHKIADDFIASDHITFGEYFKMKENQYLEKLDLTNDWEESVMMLKIYGIKQQFFQRNPFDVGDFICIGVDGLKEPTEEEKKEHETKRKVQMEEWEQRPVSFDFVYEIVMEWNSRVSSKELWPFYTYSVDPISEEVYYSHTMFSMLTTFAKDLMEEVVCPNWCGKLEYVGSSRVSVRRLYSLESNDDFPKLLNDFFEKKRLLLGLKKDPFWEWRLGGNYEENTFINHWIKKFEIGDSISFPIDKNGLGVQICLHKEAGDEGGLLADEGYGITQLVSILLQIETAILSLILMREQRRYYSGIETDDSYGNEVWTLAIEEPEIHLHPKYQSMLADMLVEAYKKYNVHFIVETHSEYLIRKLQVLVAGKGNEEDLQISKDDISILYVNSPKVVEETGEPQVKQIRIQEDGRLDSPFGAGFFDEADNQAMELLRIKAIGK